MANPTGDSEGTACTRTLQRAADFSGGVAGLARMLHVPATDLARWIAGESRPPQDIFLAALDIVSGDGAAQRDRMQLKRKPEASE